MESNSFKMTYLRLWWWIFNNCKAQQHYYLLVFVPIFSRTWVKDINVYVVFNEFSWCCFHDVLTAWICHSSRFKYHGHAIARVPKLFHNCINIRNSISQFTKNEALELVVAHFTHAINSFLTFGLISPN
jgi:hypothetical protein